jgi:hypothetical protein
LFDKLADYHLFKEYPVLCIIIIIIIIIAVIVIIIISAALARASRSGKGAYEARLRWFVV